MGFSFTEGAQKITEYVSGEPQEIGEQLLSLATLGFTPVNFAPVGPEPGLKVERRRWKCCRCSGALCGLRSRLEVMACRTHTDPSECEPGVY
jgi:hypothetical protein